MSGNIFRKTLSKSEAKYRYWRFPKEDNFFPVEPTLFAVEFVGKITILTTKYGNVLPAISFYEKYKFLENNEIIFTKKKKYYYVMEAPNTKLYAKLSPKSK
jgi:hypothetical protein